MTDVTTKFDELTAAEIAMVSGANGVVAGPDGGGCIPDLPWPFNPGPILPVTIGDGAPQ